MARLPVYGDAVAEFDLEAALRATRDAPEGRRLHSMHAYFLRPVFAGEQVTDAVRPVREGRSSRHATWTRAKTTLRP
jgi:acyl-CoA thioesterase